MDDLVRLSGGLLRRSFPQYLAWTRYLALLIFGYHLALTIEIANGPPFQ